jgi:hypothetical protein
MGAAEPPRNGCRRKSGGFGRCSGLGIGERWLCSESSSGWRSWEGFGGIWNGSFDRKERAQMTGKRRERTTGIWRESKGVKGRREMLFYQAEKAVTAISEARKVQCWTTVILYYSIFLWEIRYKRRRWYTRAYTHPYERTHVHPIPMSIFGRLSRLIDLEIDEVTAGVSLVTGTSSPTEKIFRFYETHRCQLRVWLYLAITLLKVLFCKLRFSPT